MEHEYALHKYEIRKIGTQSVQELFFCDRSIRRTVYSNDLFKFFLVAMYSKKETGNLLYMRCYIGNGKIAT